MRFGIKTAPMNTTWQAMLDVWQEADRIELFETAWNFDHFEPIFSDRSGPCLEGWSMLAAMAAHTTRIRLGCQVTGMPYRHPSVLANMAATIDIISGGRLIIGLGAGWNEDESDALGLSLAPLKQRFDQFDEGIQVIIALLTEDRASFDGQHFQLRDAWCEPKPVQRPHPPIAIGGNGEKRTLRSVARWAQHWNSTLADVNEWQRKRDVLYAHCADVGRDPAEIECSINLRYDAAAGPTSLVPRAEQWAAVGADTIIINLATPHTPEPLAAIAEALAPLGADRTAR
jgi:F420-dependent oxidoreductase-like protein